MGLRGEVVLLGRGDLGVAHVLLEDVHRNQALYLVGATKGTRDFLKLRTSEGDKVNWGKKYIEAIGVPLDVLVQATEV
jgi:restriction endonuclease